MLHIIDVILLSVFFVCFFTKKQQNGIQLVNHSDNNQQNGTYIMYHSVFKLTEWHPFCLSLLYHHSPVYYSLSSLFQPIPQSTYSTYSTISNPQSPIWNAQLCIVYPIGHLRLSSLMTIRNLNRKSCTPFLCIYYKHM